MSQRAALKHSDPTESWKSANAIKTVKKDRTEALNALYANMPHYQETKPLGLKRLQEEEATVRAKVVSDREKGLIKLREVVNRDHIVVEEMEDFKAIQQICKVDRELAFIAQQEETERLEVLSLMTTEHSRLSARILALTRNLKEMDKKFDAEWFPVEPTKQPVVHPRSGHATWWCQGTLYAYGGTDVERETNEVVSCSDGVNWEVKDTQGIPPIGTFDHSLCFFEDRRTVFIYGGTQMEGVAAAVHYLDMTPGPTFLSWKSISYRSPPNVALDRWGASAITYKDGLVILFGGADDKDTHYNDVIFYNMAKEEFELISQIPDIGRPPPRRRHGAVLYDGRLMFIAGGRDQSCFRNDLWAFQLSTKTWTLINCNVTPYDLAVPAVVSSSLLRTAQQPSVESSVEEEEAYDPEQDLEEDEETSSDVSEDDDDETTGGVKSSEEEKDEEVHIPPLSSYHPRTGLSLVLRGHRLYVLMGYSETPTQQQHYNDIHEFDLLTCHWRCLHVGGRAHPSKRSMASVDICPFTGDLIMFGGTHDDIALGDTWWLRFHPDKSVPSLRDLCVWSLRRLGSTFSPNLVAVLKNAPSHIIQELN